MYWSYDRWRYSMALLMHYCAFIAVFLASLATCHEQWSRGTICEPGNRECSKMREYFLDIIQAKDVEIGELKRKGADLEHTGLGAASQMPPPDASSEPTLGQAEILHIPQIRFVACHNTCAIHVL